MWEAGVEPQDRLGDDGEGALGADDQLGEVVAARRLHQLAAGADDLARAQHGLDAEHLVAGDAVLHRPHATRVGGHVATEAGAVLAREDGIDEPVGGGGPVELVEGHAGLHDRHVVLGVDLDDRVHPLEADEDAAVTGDAPAREAGAAAPYRHRHAQLDSQPHDGGDVLRRRGAHDDVR